LNYEHDRHLISTDTPVHISGNDSELTAASMTYDLKADKVVLTGDVVASISRTFASIQGKDKP
jgi:lipopolysaccharide export system protein LptC